MYSAVKKQDICLNIRAFTDFYYKICLISILLFVNALF